MTAFHDTLERVFPGALPMADFLADLKSTVEPVGFTTDRTLPLVSICRDELTTAFFDRIEADWGAAFTLAGLGGVPALGRTGWQAALSHVPDAAGRGAVLVFGFPHIGIEEDGTVGATIRRGQDRPTSTCGALSSIFAASQSGGLPTEIDVDDFEAIAAVHGEVFHDIRPANTTVIVAGLLDHRWKVEIEVEAVVVGEREPSQRG